MRETGEWFEFKKAKSLCVDGGLYLTWSEEWGYNVDQYQVKGSYQGFDWSGFHIGELYSEPTHFMFLPEPP